MREALLLPLFYPLLLKLYLIFTVNYKDILALLILGLKNPLPVVATHFVALLIQHGDIVTHLNVNFTLT